MPITKQVIKRVKQAKKRHDRNVSCKNDMRSLVKLEQGYIQKGEVDKAVKMMSKVVKAIDNCAKKNIIHKNNAARKKSKLQLALNELQKGGAKASAKKAAPKAEKKEEAKAE